ncbi:MAG: polyprenyl synthetase family protein [Hyphomicrobiaceae bacterium]
MAIENDGFAARLSDTARHVEQRLTLHLDRIGAAGTPPRLLSAMRHALLAGGKRFRPFLVLETARVLGGPKAVEAAMDVAAALECVHAYSLVHDDLPAMDNDETRRGHPTVWKAYDEWTAILAGDSLLTLAFEILGESGAQLPQDAPLSSAFRLRILARLASAAGPTGMVGGQMLDLEAEKLGQPECPDAAYVSRLQAMKTGALIAFAAEAGALAAGAKAEEIGAARTYGEAIGLAFQISDDLLDVLGSAETVGKAVGKDLALGKATFVAVAGIDAARARLEQAVARAVDALAGFGPEARLLREAALFQLSRQH